MPCLKEYRCAQIGRMVVYKTRSDDGTTHDHSAIMADVHECPGCAHRIVTAFAFKPLATTPSEVKVWAEQAQHAIVVIV
jgi:DNA-directed RNA polymerase subunit RPC12/RpoP